MDNKSLKERLIAGLLRHYAKWAALLWYMLFAVHYKSLFPTLWTQADSFLFFSVLLMVPAPMLIAAYFKTKDIDSNAFIEKLFDVNLYINNKTKVLDCIFSHYTNVATVGLFLMVLIFMLKPYVPQIPSIIFGPLLAASLCGIFFIYALFVLRLGVALRAKSKTILFSVGTFIVFVDMRAIDLFIRSVPQT